MLIIVIIVLSLFAIIGWVGCFILLKEWRATLDDWIDTIEAWEESLSDMNK